MKNRNQILLEKKIRKMVREELREAFSDEIPDDDLILGTNIKKMEDYRKHMLGRLRMETEDMYKDIQSVNLRSKKTGTSELIRKLFKEGVPTKDAVGIYMNWYYTGNIDLHYR